MKRYIFFIPGLLLLLSSCCEKCCEQLPISIFCDHIVSIAQQKNISFEAAAEEVRKIGYSGVDVWIDQDSDQMKTLHKLGFTIPCAVFAVDFFDGPQTDAVNAAEEFVTKYHIENVLLVPGCGSEDRYPDVIERISAFVKDASALGFKVMIEDFDNVDSPTCGTAKVSRVLESVSGLYHNFDSGNYLFSGEDCMRPLELFRNRIAHVHLKDRVSETDFACPAVGAGCIPVVYVIRSLVGNGYTGWFTVECFGNDDMLSTVRDSYENVKQALLAEEMTPDMTEYYVPSVPVADPVETDTTAPEDAIILFDGKDLSQWCGVDGQDAGWTLNPDGTMTVDKSFGDIRTRQSFGETYLLHVEWCVPEDIEGENQSRGNSGVFLNGAYEVQVLDCYGNKTYVDGQTASIYKQSVPSANPIRKPGEWNIYDISFTSPVLNEDGSLLSRPRISVVFNGVMVQDDFEIIGTTDYIGLPRKIWEVTGPISLQSHGDPSKPISFRNIWLKQL